MCEREFSVLDVTKSPVRRHLRWRALELFLKRLSLSYRKEGVDLREGLDIVGEAAVLFSTMPLQGHIANTATNQLDNSFRAVMIALYMAVV